MIKKSAGFLLFIYCASVYAVQIEDKTIRHAFFRGEKAILQYQLSCPTEEMRNAELSLNIDDIIVIEANAARNVELQLDTYKLKAGKYKAVCQFIKNKKVLSQTENLIYIARKWSPDRMRVWLWPHRKFGERVYKLNDEAIRQLQWYSDKGFNSFVPGGGMVMSSLNYGGFTKDKLALFDYALYNGWEMGFALCNGLFVDIDDPNAEFKMSRPFGGREVMTNPFHPVVAAIQNRQNEETMQTVRHFPGIGVCYLESEYEDLVPHILPLAMESYSGRHISTTKHKFIAPGVIADNDEGYINRIYKYKWGDGLTVGNKRAADTVHKYRPDIFVFGDPLRKTTVYGRYTGIDAISTWTYTEPDPKFMLYIETLIANGKPFKQGVIPTTTLLSKTGTAAPQHCLMGPDRLIENNWINLSRRPDGLSFYTGSTLDQFDSNEPYQKYPPTFEALKCFVNEVVIPYGPMIKNLNRYVRRAAVLSSESSRVYSASPKLLGNWDNYQVYSFYSLLNMAHIPADIVFDETIAEYGLAGYEVLVLPKCDTLTSTVYEKILDFQRKGGLVISDQYLRAEIPNVIKFNFDFTYRNNISAKAIIEGQDYVDKNDDESRYTRVQKVKGVTAEEDQKIMERYAEELYSVLKDKITLDVDCDSPTVLLNMLEKDGVKYLFVINDKRTYDERLGKFKAILEKGVSQTAKIKLNSISADNLYLYDIIEHHNLSYLNADQHKVFDVNLPAAGGKIIAITSQNPENIEIELPDVLKQTQRYKFDIFIKDKNGLPVAGIEPLEIKIIDPVGGESEFSDYYAAKSGKCSVDFLAGLNDNTGKWQIEVKDLITGKNVKKYFQLSR